MARSSPATVDRLSFLRACDFTLSSPYRGVLQGAYSLMLGLTPQDDFLYFSFQILSLWRALPSQISNSSVCRPVHLIDFGRFYLESHRLSSISSKLYSSTLLSFILCFRSWWLDDCPSSHLAKPESCVPLGSYNKWLSHLVSTYLVWQVYLFSVI